MDEEGVRLPFGASCCFLTSRLSEQVPATAVREARNRNKAHANARNSSEVRGTTTQFKAKVHTGRTCKKEDRILGVREVSLLNECDHPNVIRHCISRKPGN